MKRKKISRFNSFVMVMLIISFLFGFCGVGTLFGDKNEVSQTEEVSTLTGNPAKVIPEKEPVIDSGNYTVKTWDERLEEIYANGEEIDFPVKNNRYQISTAEQLALLSYLSNHGGIAPYPSLMEYCPGYIKDQTNKVVPEGFSQFEYLQFNGGQYIDTGYIPTSNTKVEFEFLSTNASTCYNFFCSRESVTSQTFTLFRLNGYNTRFDYNDTQKNIQKDFGVVVKHKIIVDKNKTYFDGSLVCTAPESDFTAGGNMWIGASYDKSDYTGITNYAYMKLYSFKIYENDELVRDFIPAGYIEEDVVGFYDIENKQFYKNQGSGKFNSFQTLSISNKTFELTNDIYLNDGKLGLNETTDESGKTTYSIAYEDGGDGVLYQWTPISQSEESYWGGYGLGIFIYGNDYSISGMHINSTKKNLGLISGWGHYSWGADSGGQYMEKVHMKNTLVYAPTSTNVGGLIGYPTCGKVVNCSFDGYIVGGSYVSPLGFVYAAGVSGLTNYGKIIALSGEGCGIGRTQISNSTNYGEVVASYIAAGIASSAYGSVSNNCVNYGKITSLSNSAYGISCKGATNCINYGNVYSPNFNANGIGGDSITNCINYGNINGKNISCGIGGGATISNSINYGEIKGSNVASGISYNPTLIQDCTNHGNITTTNYSYGIGVAKNVKNCKNYGIVRSTAQTANGIGGTAIENSTNFGMIIGNTDSCGIANNPTKVYNCSNYGAVKGGTTAGGVAVTLSASAQIFNTSNCGDVTSETANAGGLVGVISGGTVKIIQCENVGKVTAKTTSTTTYAGGLVGSITGGSTTIESCTNEGKVSGKTATGLVGSSTTASTEIKNSLNNGDITSSTYEGTTLLSTFGVSFVSQITNCITSSKINGKKVNACVYVKDGYFSEQYRTGKIVSSNASHTAMFQGVIDSNYITENNFVDFTPKPMAMEFTKLEYIQSNGTQYIATGYVPTINTGFELDYLLLANAGNFCAVLYTGVSGNSNSGYGLHYYDSNTISQVGSYKYTESGQTLSRRTYTFNVNAEVKIGNEFKENIPRNEILLDKSSKGISLFGATWTNTSYVYYTKSRIYDCKIYENDKVVRQFIPARRNSDGMVGLYETTEGKFYTDVNGGSFDAGPEVSFVPDGYTELKSIKSNGSQYIDTGVLSQNNLGCHAKFSFNNNDSEYQYLLGELTAGKSRFCPIFIDNVNNLDNISYSSTLNFQACTYGAFDTNEHVVEYNIDGTRKIKYDTKTVGSVETTANGTGESVYLFARNYTGADKFAVAKIYFLKMFDKGNLIRDFIPVKRNSDGMVGLYDTVEGKFYTDANGGNFEVGEISQIPAGYTELESIKSNGSQYINTGFVFSGEKLRIDFKCSFPQKANENTWNYLFGSQIGSGTTALRNVRFCSWCKNGQQAVSISSGGAGAESAQVMIKPYNNGELEGFYEQNESEKSVYAKINDVVYNGNFTSSSKTGKTEKLFGTNDSGSNSKAILYYFNICENGVLIRNFIPAKRNSDGMLGLYDTVEGKFYTDANGGKFEVGD